MTNDIGNLITPPGVKKDTVPNKIRICDPLTENIIYNHNYVEYNQNLLDGYVLPNKIKIYHKAKVNPAYNATDNRNVKHGCKLKCGSVNARSVINITDLIYQYLQQNDLDLYLIVEAWCDPKNPNHMKEISKLRGPTYNCKLTPRVGRTGGGILVAYKQNLKVQKMKPPNTHTFEIMEILVQSEKRKLGLWLFTDQNLIWKRIHIL